MGLRGGIRAANRRASMGALIQNSLNAIVLSVVRLESARALGLA